MDPTVNSSENFVILSNRLTNQKLKKEKFEVSISSFCKTNGHRLKIKFEWPNGFWKILTSPILQLLKTGTKNFWNIRFLVILLK